MNDTQTFSIYGMTSGRLNTRGRVVELSIYRDGPILSLGCVLELSSGVSSLWLRNFFKPSILMAHFILREPNVNQTFLFHCEEHCKAIRNYTMIIISLDPSFVFMFTIRQGITQSW